jgi:exopolysaccharide biosynthesis polyprenyl glycosylphosphotransferase
LFVVCDQSNYFSVVESLKINLDWSRRICGLCIVDYANNCDLKLSSINTGKINAQMNFVKKDDLQIFLTSNNVDELFVYTDYAHADEQLKKVISDSEKMGIRVNVRINLDLFDFLPKSYTKVDRIGKYYCVSISRNFVSYPSRVMKSMLDYVGGLVGFLIFCVAFIILGPVIKLDSKGPIIFSQNRVGRNGRIFKCYKFRSMRQDAEELKKTLVSKNEMRGLMFKMDNDPRVTRVGKFLRKTSLDELPQFINVLKGDMSLVGTRPPTVDEYEKYRPEHKARVSMMPGLTGLWQVSGRSDIKDFDEVVRLDMRYIDNSSFWLDIKIILMTVKVVLFGRGAK